MTTRILPPEEWSSLAGTELERVATEVMNRDGVSVIVVEDEGEIIGCWALMTVAHVEGLWIAPTHRRRGGVFRKLWRAMCQLTLDRGIGSVFTHGATADMRTWIQAFGGERMTGEGFVLPMSRRVH